MAKKKSKKSKDTTTKRIGRGLKVIGKKFKDGYTALANSEFVKNQQAMQEASDKGELPSMAPEGLLEGNNKSEDSFSTKLPENNEDVFTTKL
jgi:hypothetical protein